MTYIVYSLIFFSLFCFVGMFCGFGAFDRFVSFLLWMVSCPVPVLVDSHYFIFIQLIHVGSCWWLSTILENVIFLVRISIIHASICFFTMISFSFIQIIHVLCICRFDYPFDCSITVSVYISYKLVTPYICLCDGYISGIGTF